MSTLESETLIRRRSSLSESKRAFLERRLKSQSAAPASAAIARRIEGEPVNLSSAQRRLWFVGQLQPRSAVYNTPLAVRLRGPLEVPALRAAFDALLLRHEALRTRLIAGGSAPVQVIVPPEGVPLAERDLTAVPPPAREAALQSSIQEEIGRPIDYQREAMLRCTLYRLALDEHVLVILLHHIASDLWSWEILFRELAEFYAQIAAGTPALLPPLPIQYADYACWERRWLGGPEAAAHLAYWKQKLEGVPALLDLPADRPRPAMMGFRGAVARHGLPRPLVRELRAWSRREGGTLFMLLLAAFQVLLHRLTSQTDIVVGIPTAGRTNPQTRDLIGLFVNTLPLRGDATGDPEFGQFFQQVRTSCLDGLLHAQLPLDKLVEEIRPVRDLAFLPLVQVMFTLQKRIDAAFRLPGVSSSPVAVDQGTTRLDLMLVAEETGEDIELMLEYNTELFEAETAQRMLTRYHTLLEGIVAGAGRRLSELPLLDEVERRQVLVEWNADAGEVRPDLCLHQLFEAQARITPRSDALVAGPERLTYAELNRRADRLAETLRGFGVGRESRVGIHLPRSAEMVVALLAVLKAGGAYVPLDPAYPADRIAFILRDARTSVILSRSALARTLPGDAGRVVCLDDLAAEAGRPDPGPGWAPPVPSALAYIIYTSGSTGRPKGVMIEHRNAVAFVHWAQTVFSAGELAGVLAGTSICFDLSIFELFVPLSRGGKVILAENALALIGLAAANEVRLVNTVPSVMAELLRAGSLPPTVRTVNLAGEPLPTRLVNQLYALPHVARVYDLYGPTETTTYSTFALRQPDVRPTIGRPIARTRLYLLDRHLQPVPVGVPGELYIGGAGVTRGYHDRPELTAERFLPDPFGAGPEARIYRTGDLCRYAPDGALEYLRRADDQVKIRGFRIEPREVESVLRGHPQLADAAVAVRTHPVAGPQLIGYVVFKPGSGGTDADLKSFLRRTLPDSMIPSRFVSLDRLPQTPNGKVDRAALPEPSAAEPARRSPALAPRDGLEARLAAVWESVLGIKPVGVSDSFFDLGGHSLLAVRLASQIEGALGQSLPVAAIFRAPTVEQLAALIRDRGRSDQEGALLPIQPKGSRPPLYLVHGMGGGMMWGYANLAAALGEDQPVYAFKSCEPERLEEFDTVEKMAAHYVAELRRFQPEGPYRIGGYCFGGTVAQEMARQIEAGGGHVSLLLLMNAWPSNVGDRMRLTPLHLAKFAGNLWHWGSRLWRWNRSHRLHVLGWKARAVAGRVEGWWRSSPRPEIPEVDRVFDLAGVPQGERKLWEGHFRAIRLHRTKPCRSHVTLLRTRGYPLFCSFDPAFGWKALVQEGVTVRMVPGLHENLLADPHVQATGEALSGVLSERAG